jgi:phosphatidylserine/phosphatidylglycerophosphate/cardiolipin synthase-like enzyme
MIVVPAQTDDGQDPISSHGQALQYDFFTKLAANINPNQLRVYTMQGRFIHSKFILVDDRAMSIGSANANPRSFQMDTEIGVLTDNNNLTRNFRHRLWSHNLGLPQKEVQTWSINQFFSKWDAIAKTNQSRVGRPDQLLGEGVIPFANVVKGSKSRVIPDVLAENEPLLYF